MNSRHTALSIAVALALTACASGGGGGGSTAVAPAPGGGGSGSGSGSNTGSGSTQPAAWVTPERVILATDAAGNAVVPVKVGVLDSGFNVNHQEFQGVVAGAGDFGNTGTLLDDKVVHGSYVAQIIAGVHAGYSGNVRLLLGKAADPSGLIYTSTVGRAGEWAIDNGARVVNLSLDGALTSISAGQLKGMYDRAVANQAVLVMAAGNNGKNLSADPQYFGNDALFAAGNQSYQSLSLIVGALDSNRHLAAYSNYAGGNKAVQQRFLVAPGDNQVVRQEQTAPPQAGDTIRFSGTSSATPVVAAAAATLRANWTHLSAGQTADLLLQSADKTFSSLYASNSCGGTGNENCGYFYFGQGRLDLASAMKPQGKTVIPTGSTVDGPSHTVATTRLALPAAFGDAASRQLNVNAAFIDGYGRDYAFRLSQLATGTNSMRLAERMDTLVNGSRQSFATPYGNAYAAFDGDGQRTLSLASAEVGNLGFTFVSGKGDQVQQEPLGVETLSLSGGLLAHYAQAHGLGASMKLDGGVKISTRAFTASEASTLQDNAGTGARYESSVSFTPREGTTASIGLAQTADRGTALGMAGKGALNLGNSVTDSLLLGLSTRLNGGYSAFANAEFGRMGMDNGTSSLIRSLEGVRTSQFALGLSWAGLLADGKASQFVAALSQPLRVDAATALLNLPVGRTDDGKVRYEVRSTNLTPSGRQLNAEIAFRQQLTKSASFGVNAVYARDAGHVRGDTDWIVMGSYRARF